MRFLIKAVLLLSCTIGVYLFVMNAQMNAAAALCAAHPVGSRIDSVEALPGTFYLTRMGPAVDPGQPDVQDTIFCAGTTMCDTSCRLKTKQGVVVEADFRDF